MATTTMANVPTAVEPEQRLIIDRVDWDQYAAISDALGERHKPRLIYLDGSLTFLVTSFMHDWLSEWLNLLVVAVANGCGITWKVAGQATFRSKALNVGVEGDKTYYFGVHAEQMQGQRDIDLATQPPPDLVIEVEVSHPADRSLAIWGRLGVPEVWRFNAEKGTVGFWSRREDGTYAPIDRSANLPMLTPEDIRDQIQLADSLLDSVWYAQLSDWVRDVLVPRLGNGR